MKWLVCVVAVSGGAVFGAKFGGRVDEIRAEVSRIRAECARENRPLGIADEFGNYNLTDEGRRIAELEEELRRQGGETGEASESALAQGWGTRPLGQPGTLKYGTSFAKKPEFRERPVRKPGMMLFGAGTKVAIFADTRDPAVIGLAREFAWHLSEMSGEQFLLSAICPTNGPAVIFRIEVGDDARAIVRREGDVLFVSGSGPGIGHATTYVLESLGCRYLWPGTSGKVIPRRKEIVLPELSLDFKPALSIRGVRAEGRGMRPGDRAYDSLKRLGFDPAEFARMRKKASVDHDGNRGFWQWHGVNDTKSVHGYFASEARYRWGHYYGDYVERYKDAHPEWFALQPDGRRVKAKMSRPCFCLSNRELADETARNLLGELRRSPRTLAVSACLPDGGHDSMCMCEGCRRLDPVNAPPLLFGVNYPTRRTFPYVSRTDRVFEFFNRIAEGVAREMPDRGVCVYAYSSYEAPPVKVRPHPSLVILSVAGSYVSRPQRNHARENLAAWSSFGNALLWRPNALGGFRAYLPQNYARPLFEDIELFKANGLMGTDFDCNDGCFSTKGLVYYMLARALLNPDHLDYESIYSDYLDSGFGPAAGVMRKWFDSLEADFERAAGLDVEQIVKSSGHKAAAGFRKNRYVTSFDLAKYEAILAEAEKLAGSDAAIVRRIRFFRTGLEYAGWEQRKAICEKERSKAKSRQEIQRAYYDFIHAKVADPDSLVGVNPSGIGFYDSFLRPYLLERAKRGL